MKKLFSNVRARVAASSLLLAWASTPAFAAPCEPRIQPDGYTVVEGESVKLNGSPSKPNSAGFAWTQVSGPAGILSNANTDKPTFKAPLVEVGGATAVVKLTLSGCSPSASLTAIINITDLVPENYAPDVSAIVSPAAAFEGDVVSLDGSASSDPDGDSLAFAWTQIGGPPVTLVNATSAIATFIAPNTAYPDGDSLTFRLTVSDGLLSGFTDKIANIVWVNDPPTAALSCPATVNEGDTITLDGTASSDSDDGIATWAWSQILGPPNIDLSGFTGSSASFSAPQLGYQQIGAVPFKLTISDPAGASSAAECTVFIADITPPVFSGASDTLAEATSPAGAPVSFLVTAYDNVDGDVAVACSPESGSTFALGETTVNCSAQDSAGNPAATSFTVSVVDTTAPVITAPANVTAEATGPLTTVVHGNATATDAVGVQSITSDAPSQFPVGITTITWLATDTSGNTASTTSTVTVTDTTPPAISAQADISLTATSAAGAVGTYTLPTAIDLVDGEVAVQCAPVSGSTFAVGSTTVTCTASDSLGNFGELTFKVIVSYQFNGFFKPVDNLPVVNVVKAGSSIPVKFSLGGNMGLAIMAPGYPRSAVMACQGGVQDAVEETVTAGNSSLSYDAATGQYIYVWKSEKAWSATCRQLQVKLADGTTHVANFSFTR